MVHRMRRSTPPTRRARTRPSSLDPSAFRPTPIGWPASGDGLPAGRDHGRRRAAPSPIPVRIFGRGRGSRCCGCLRRRRRAPGQVAVSATHPGHTTPERFPFGSMGPKVDAAAAFASLPAQIWCWPTTDYAIPRRKPCDPSNSHNCSCRIAASVDPKRRSDSWRRRDRFGKRFVRRKVNRLTGLSQPLPAGVEERV